MSTGLISAEKYRTHLFAKGFWGYVHSYLGWGRAFLLFGYGVQLSILVFMALMLSKCTDIIEIAWSFYIYKAYILKLMSGLYTMFLLLVTAFFEVTTGKYLSIPNTFYGFVLMLPLLSLLYQLTRNIT